MWSKLLNRVNLIIFILLKYLKQNKNNCKKPKLQKDLLKENIVKQKLKTEQQNNINVQIKTGFMLAAAGCC